MQLQIDVWHVGIAMFVLVMTISAMLVNVMCYIDVERWLLTFSSFSSNVLLLSNHAAFASYLSLLKAL